MEVFYSLAYGGPAFRIRSARMPVFWEINTDAYYDDDVTAGPAGRLQEALSVSKRRT